MTSSRAEALKQNFVFFQNILGEYLDAFRGRYVLVHEQSVIGIFEHPIDALEAGSTRFGNDVFSVQKVTDRPSDLGFMANGAGDRSPD